MDPYTRWSTTLKAFHDHFRHDLLDLIKEAERLKRKSPTPVLRATSQYLQQLHMHHTIEDRMIFPFLARKMDVSKFAEDHEQLDVVMDKISAVCKGNSSRKGKPADGEEFDEEGFTGLLVELKELVFPHMQLEEDLTQPDKMKQMFSAQEMASLLH
ncbi:hypothetical protein HK104_007599 [Borealophlyctis nickersoniae]|nr:hypothetical protein HK104_007599 [Borealophlyctis nickersoniae]